jgi:DNA-binding MarR family transcriptional regulator
MIERKQNKSAAARRHSEPSLDFSLLPELLGYRLRLAQVAVFRHFAGHVGDGRISPGLFGVLLLVRANPGVTQARLAAAIAIDRSTMVSVIDTLERRKWLERRPADGDRRAFALHLTAAGARLTNRLEKEVLEHEAELGRGFSPAEREQLLHLLGRLGEVG